MYKKVIAVVVVLAAILFYTLDSDKNYRVLKPQLKASIISHESDRVLPSFSLIDHNNHRFDNDNLKGDWTLLLFIYTHCPDVCPTELANMSLLKATLANNDSIVVPNIVAITFDPLRDTPEALKTYVAHFDEDFLGVSGDQKTINQLVKSFHAYYEKVLKDKHGKEFILQAKDPLPDYALEEGYIINHTAQIYLISPDGKKLAEFPTPHNIINMADDIDLIIKHYQK